MSLSTGIGVVGAAAATGFRLLKSGEFHPWSTRIFGVAKPQYPISGLVKPGYQEVEQKFRQHFEQGKEVGASVAVYVGGKLMVELYGGYMDLANKTPYSKKSLQLVYSCSKFMESIALARLVDKGYLKYDDLVTKFWPEFGQLDKDKVTIADLMRHEGGVTYFDDPQPTREELLDLDKLGNRICQQPHLWKGEKIRSYHAVTRGFILNEIVRRVDPKHRTLGKIYKEDFNPALDTEFYLGLDTPELLKRRTKWYSYPILDALMVLLLPTNWLGSKAVLEVKNRIAAKGKPFYNVLKLKNGLDKDFENGNDILASEIPSVNGFTNARSLAAVASCVANQGQADGHQFISKEAVKALVNDPVSEFDTCIHMNSTMTQGGLGEFTFEELGTEHKFYGWAGLGGSFVLFNLEHKFSFAYTMNAAHISVLVGGRAGSLLIAAFKAHLKTVSK